MLVSPPSGVCEALKKMGIMVVLPNYGFNVSLRSMAYCQSRDSDCVLGNGFSTTLAEGKRYEFLSRIPFSTIVRLPLANPLVVMLGDPHQ